MKNVAEIQNIAEAGDLSQAHSALDALLSMGPRNIEALKLRARLYEVAGRFQMESKIWDQISKIDQDDNDLLQYISRKQAEDRENFYFTDSLPGGGKRFIAFQRKFIRSVAVGLTGCIVFMILARLAHKFPALNDPSIITTSFTLFVVAPCIGFILSYIKGLRHVSVTKHGIELVTLFRSHRLAWNEVEQVYLAQDDRQDIFKLTLLVLTKDSDRPNLEMDFDEHTTPIRARSYFVREIISSWGEPLYIARKTVNTDGRKLLKV
jgi:tetratricopeptide (TPR) repeat protein